MKKITLLFASLCLLMQMGFAQSKTVTGVVTAKEDGFPIIGASILVKGTTTGTITDIDGNYSIQVPDGGTLVFTYVGMKKQELQPSSGVLNVVMISDAVAIEEVVVTAMGVKQEKKKMNFAVQSLNADNLIESKDANFVNSLQGKIAGVSVTSAGGSPNSGSQMVIRGISSINPSQNNEPLFIIDGMQVAGGASKAADINPNDIENVTVLKGAAASALYGQEAANGVVMITTKAGQVGKVKVNASASVQIDNAVRVPKIQRTYAPGSSGLYKEQTTGGRGPLIQDGEQTYDNVGNFLGTGVYQKYDLSASGGTDHFTGYASASYSNTKGIVPEDYLNKIGVMLKGTYTIKNVTMNAMLNITNNASRGFGASMSSIYAWPINDDMSNYINADGTMRRLYIADEKQNSPVNPYWGRYMDYGKNESTRNLIQGSISWKAFKNFDITGRVSYDQTNSSSNSYSTPRWDESDFTAEELEKIDKSVFGEYYYSQSKSKLLNANAVATYKIELPKDFSIDLMAGAELKMSESISSTLGGRDFVLPGEYYSQQNVSEVINGNDVTLYRREKRNYGFYGEARFDYKGLAHISGTVRNDHSSTLDPEHNSYVYPSVTAGLIWSEAFGSIANEWFSYGKLRGNWAMVGKDAVSYLFDRKYKTFTTFPDGGYAIDPARSTAQGLRPEMTSSWEIGLDLRFFNSKTKLDVAYYSTQVDDQIVNVRVSPASGYILQTRNEGSVKNHGVEISLEQQIMKTKNIEWTASANFGLNRGTVLSLPEQITELQGTQYTDMFPTAYLGGSTTAISGKDYLRTNDGQIICSADGTPMIDPQKQKLIGNREPDFLLGVSTNFRWKDLSIGLLLDGRCGGDVMNITSRGLYSNGQHRSLEFYRNRQIIFDGVVQQGDGTYVPNTTPVIFDQKFINDYFYAVSSNFIEDGSYIRLSYVTIAYDFGSFLKKTPITGLKLSVTGRNLFLLTHYSGNDPQININTSSGGTGGMGIDNYNVPTTRSFNFNLNISF
ncbi:MAG: SusC/RagA family TonB-linked outer membrane protein [Sphingobacteriia bacterium]|nr:SusC/RagA family TonB-linked outer membrane protein [Sphingobacteriia bacterium]